MPATRRVETLVLTALFCLAGGTDLVERQLHGAGIDHPALIAHWSFDETAGLICSDVSGQGNEATAESGREMGLTRVPGVFGHALHLTGRHLIRVPAKLRLGGLRGITLSAWAQPAVFDRYNEIFRKEDGERRVLFSFQENGSVLSLGLNINGYIECDAKLDPAAALDGQWHHCVSTFDGEWMRVYFDGRQLGATRRPGKILADGPALGCIGSLQGTECFQGGLDDLRLYGAALTAAEVEMLFRAGQPSLERWARERDQRLAAFFVPGQSLALTLAGTRQKLLPLAPAATRDAAIALVNRIKMRHREEFSVFVTCTRVSPLEFLQSADPTLLSREAARLVESLVEYKPLTAEQWQRQKPDELRQWKEVEEIERQFDRLKAQRDASDSFSSEWIQLLLDAGRRVQLRPYLQEAVAPYVRPQTPETRTLSAAAARSALERDWLHQADRQPTLERVRNEIEWARQLAARIKASAAGGAVNCAEELAGLDEVARLLPGSLVSGSAASARERYLRVRELKRRIVFKNPAVDFDKLLFVDMPFPQGSEWQHETRHRLGYMAVPGGRLLVLEGLSPEGKLRQLMPRPPLHGSFWRPDVSWDGRRVLFCFKPHNEKAFHLYEIGVDGSGFRQLTDGPYDDLDPVYLPDEQHVVFSTTRGHTYVRCMPPTSAFVLARCDRSGHNVYLISANNEPDYLPSVLADGRLIYTRWEYTDKPLWRAQKLWTVHPDGTQVNTLWGNQSVWPDLLKDARGIPGSRRVMFTGSAHHDWFAGSVGIVDPAAGVNFPHGLTKVTAEIPWPECGNGPVDPIESPRYQRSGHYSAYYSPYPLSEHDFLVSANRAGQFVLYLMDVDGNRELIYEGQHHIFHAMPLKPRTRPPVIDDVVKWPVAGSEGPPGPGVIYSRDVYQGAPAALRGKARFLRVLSIDHKTYTYWHQRPYLSTGPVVSGVQSDGVKRILGTVPIETDGSVAFEAPSGIPLHFQLLDGEQRALHTMRSFANVMPGEYRGCLGCHERHSRAPEAQASDRKASTPMRTIRPPPWSDTTVSYARYVRPVLDRYCVSCHGGDAEGGKALDLSVRPGFLEFDEPYWILIGRPTWGQPYQPPPAAPPGWGFADMLMVEAFGTTDPAGYRTPEPMTGLSCKSRLIELASSGKHYDVKVDALNLLRLTVWVDTLCPYRGEEEIRAIPDPQFQGVDWLAVRPKIRNAPHIARPGPVN